MGDPSTTPIDNGNLPVKLPVMSLVSGEKTNFQFILRLLNTNVDGKQKVMYALTKIKGVGRRYSNLVCKKADVDLNKRAGELTSEELERIVTIIQDCRCQQEEGLMVLRKACSCGCCGECWGISWLMVVVAVVVAAAAPPPPLM